MPTYTNNNSRRNNNNNNRSKISTTTNHYHHTKSSSKNSTIKHIPPPPPPPREAMRRRSIELSMKLTHCANCTNRIRSNINNNNNNSKMIISSRKNAGSKHFNCTYSNLKRCFKPSFAFFLAFASLMFVIISLFNINGVHSLNCYHCSSVDNPECDEAFTGRANFTNTDCEKHIGQPAKVCRKIVQYIESKKVIIRSCGYIDEHDEKDRKPICYKRSGTFAIMMESCNCYEDNCNHSASLVPNRSVLIALLTTCTLPLIAYIHRSMYIYV